MNIKAETSVYPLPQLSNDIEWYRMWEERQTDGGWRPQLSRKGIVGNISVRHKNVEMILNAHPDSRQAVYKKIYLLTLLLQQGNSF